MSRSETDNRAERSETLATVFFLLFGINAYANYVGEWLPFLNPVLSVLRTGTDIALIAIALPALGTPRTWFLKLLFFIFLVTSSVTFLNNQHDVSLLTHLNGLREPVVLFSTLFFYIRMLTGPDAERFIARMDRFLKIFIAIQLPVAILQFLQYGAGDEVGGTFSDGGSGMLSQVLFLTVYYFLLRYHVQKNGTALDFRSGWTTMLFLFPIFINETKISLVLMILFFALQFRLGGNWVKKTGLVVGAAVILFGFLRIYSATDKWGTSFMDFFDEDEFAKYYLSDWEGSEDITRFGKIIILTEKYFDTDQKMDYGIGFGFMKGKSILQKEGIGKDLEYLWTGSRVLVFTTLIQGGLTFTYLIAILNGSFFVGWKRRFTPVLRRYWTFAFALFLTMWLYNEALLVTYFVYFGSYFLVYHKYYVPVIPENA